MIAAGGDLKEILADLSITIKCIHAQLNNQAPIAAAAFKEALKMGAAMEDGLIWGGKVPEFVGMGFSSPKPPRRGGE